MISFIVPAHNEELLIGAAAHTSIHAAARDAGVEYELIVVDDASTDGTARIAAEHAARVLPVNKRQIAAVRNSKATAFAKPAATSSCSSMPIRLLRPMPCVRSWRRSHGGAGGGCLFRFDGRLPFWARLTYPIGICLFRVLTIVGGCFLFCTREAFLATGGFSEECFAAEELPFPVIPCAALADS